MQEKNFDGAIHEYQNALKFIEDLGHGWETYISNINNTISNVQKLKNSQIQKKYEIQQKLEKRKQAELEFQKQITIQLEKERERLAQKEIIIKDKQKEIIHVEQRKKEAFGFYFSKHPLENLNFSVYDRCAYLLDCKTSILIRANNHYIVDLLQRRLDYAFAGAVRNTERIPGAFYKINII